MAFLDMIFGAVGQGVNAGAANESARQTIIAAEGEAAQLEQRAGDTLAAGTFKADQIRKRAEEILSSQRAQAAAVGNDTASGSTLEFAKETVRNASMDQLLAMMDAQDDANKDRFAAKVTRTTGQRDARLTQTRAAAEGISTIGTIMGDAADWKSKYGSKKSSSHSGSLGSSSQFDANR